MVMDSLSEHGVDVGIGKGATGVQLIAQFLEIREPRVQRGHVSRGEGEYLSPMRSWRERREGGFDFWQ